MGKLPLIGTPYSMVSIDFIREISPASDRGHRYILVVVDMCTRFPDAIPLKNIDTCTVAEALIGIFSRVGFPNRIHSVNGAQLVSSLMVEIERLLSIKHTTSTAFHPAGNGVVENTNKTVKNMLKKLN